VSSKLKAVVFDFDGVILESAGVKTDAFCALYESYGPSVVEKVLAHHLANLGVSRFKKFEWIANNILDKPLAKEESVALGERFSALALERVIAAPFVRGADAALAALAPRLPLMVASGTPQDELDHIVDARGLRKFFCEVHGTPREKPVILRAIMAERRLAPSEVLFVGDGLTDHSAARATDVAFLARDTAELHDEWVKLAARRVADLQELPEIVETWTS